MARRTTVVAMAAAALLLPSAAAQADAGGRVRTVQTQDDCEPVSFEAALGPGACAIDGDTTFDELVGQLVATGDAPEWRFHSDHPTVRSGEVLRVTNTGGEFHTFSEVASFGGGCVPPLNALLGLEPVPECAPEAAPGLPLAFVTTGVAPGASLDVTGLSRGTHFFECLIHPWMRATVTVRS